MLTNSDIPDDSTPSSSTTSTTHTEQSKTALVAAQMRDDLHDNFEIASEVLSKYVLLVYQWMTKESNYALADASMAMSRTNEADRNKHLR